MNKKLLIGLIIGVFIAGGLTIFAAPVGTVLRSVLPETDNTYYLGTTSPRTYWANVYTRELTVSTGSATTTIGSATTTLAGGLVSSAGVQLSLAGFANCNLDTDANGFLQCGTDATGSGDVTVNTGTQNRLAYYSSTNVMDSFNGVTVDAGAASSSWATLNVRVLNATSTGYIDTLTLGNALTVANGGTGIASCTDGGVMLGSGTGAVTCTSVLTNGQLLIGDGTTDPTLATLTGTADEITITNGAGTITIDIPDPFIVGKGGSGAASFTDGGVLLGSGSGAFTAMSVLADGEMIVGDGTTDPVAESGATLRTSIGVGTGDTPQFTGIFTTGSSTLQNLWVNVGGATTSKLYVTDNIRTNIGSTTGATTHTLRPRDCGFDSCRHQRIILQANTNIILNSTSSGPMNGDIIDATFVQSGTFTLSFVTNNIIWQAGDHATPTVPTTVGACLRVMFQFWDPRWVASATSTGAASQCPPR